MKEDICAKIARYIEAKQRLTFELVDIAHSYGIGGDGDTEAFKQAYEEYINAHKDIPESVLERLDKREEVEI